MLSLRARLLRLVIRHVVGPKFVRAGMSVPAWRALTDQLTGQQKIPPGTRIRPVSAGGVVAEWVQAPASRPDRAVLYLHGGGFVMGSPATHRELAARFAAALEASVLSLDYSLAPEHPFPAAVHDAVAAYRWLLASGYPPGRLAIGGDSAGAALTLQSLFALRDEGARLPAAAFFLSPPIDCVRFDGESYVSRAGLDPWITLELCRFTAAQYVGDADPESPLLDPLRGDFSGLPPLCVHVGDHEVLLSDSVRLAELARAGGVQVDLKIWPGMWHVFQATARFVPEARRSIDEIGAFVVERFG